MRLPAAPDEDELSIPPFPQTTEVKSDCCININYSTELSADKHATTTELVLSAEISHLHFSCIVFFGCHFIDFIPIFLAKCV